MYRFGIVEETANQILMEESPNRLNGTALVIISVCVLGIAIYPDSPAHSLPARVVVATLALGILCAAMIGFVRSKIMFDGNTGMLRIRRRLGGFQFNSEHRLAEIREIYETIHPRRRLCGLGLRLSSGKKRPLSIWEESYNLTAEAEKLNQFIQKFR